jgi:hypothetical protein
MIVRLIPVAWPLIHVPRWEWHFHPEVPFPPGNVYEGCEVRIEPVSCPQDDGGDEGPPPPEEIAAQLALMDQLEPGWLSPAEDAAWRAAPR